MGKYELPPVPYSYDALEPYIDARTMEIHHTKHHQTYTDKLNAALEKCPPEIQEKDVLEILSNIGQVPADQKGAINFNGGGCDNHRIFWNNMKPNGGGEPGGSIADAINTSFGSFSGFKEKFSSTTALIQGSGWGWLVYSPSSRKVEYKSMPNQTSPRTEGLVPLLGCDVWEHAYYLKYQNKRPDYISAWWNVVNSFFPGDLVSKAVSCLLFLGSARIILFQINHIDKSVILTGGSTGRHIIIIYFFRILLQNRHHVVQRRAYVKPWTITCKLKGGMYHCSSSIVGFKPRSKRIKPTHTGFTRMDSTVTFLI